MENKNPELTWRLILVFWLPLAATWLMMALEGPFLSAVIARMPAPKFNLAAYGVSFSLALIAEAPILMIMSAANALVSDSDSLVKMKRFTYGLNILITLALLLFLLPPIFDPIARGLIGLPARVASLTHGATIILLPWPAAIGYRRLYQGILIHHNRTRFVAYGTVIRLGVMGTTALAGYLSLPWPGVYVGSLALSAGVVAEAVASRLMAQPVLKALYADQSGQPPGQGRLSYSYIARFYYPLALTPVLALGVRPIVTFFVGQSRMALESLAILPVIISLLFIPLCLGISFQEVVIARLDPKLHNYRPLRNFALGLVIVTVGGLVVTAFTPAAYWWFHSVAGLSWQLTGLSILPIQIAAVIPGLWTLVCFQRAVLVNARRTAPITKATLAEVSVIIATMMLTIWYLDLVGAVAAIIALVAGSLTSAVYQYLPFRQILRRQH
ncbi:MAG: hypothetical protein PVG03_14555 [Desulfarculaceae bacterium]